RNCMLTGSKAQMSGSSQSVFFSHGSPSCSGGAQTPCVPKMSQRLGSRHIASSQHTPLVQKPVPQTSGLVQGAPVGTAVGSGVHVGVAVGIRTQSPPEPETLQDWPPGHDWEVQHTPSSVLQK